MNEEKDGDKQEKDEFTTRTVEAASHNGRREAVGGTSEGQGGIESTIYIRPVTGQYSNLRMLGSFAELRRQRDAENAIRTSQKMGI